MAATVGPGNRGPIPDCAVAVRTGSAEGPDKLGALAWPGWPFASYVWLSLAGLLLLGVGVLVGGWPGWLGWLTLVADGVFVAGYVRYGDIPPFVFSVLLTVVGAGVLAG